MSSSTSEPVRAAVSVVGSSCRGGIWGAGLPATAVAKDEPTTGVGEGLVRASLDHFDCPGLLDRRTEPLGRPRRPPPDRGRDRSRRCRRGRPPAGPFQPSRRPERRLPRGPWSDRDRPDRGPRRHRHRHRRSRRSAEAWRPERGFPSIWGQIEAGEVVVEVVARLDHGYHRNGAWRGEIVLRRAKPAALDLVPGRAEHAARGGARLTSADADPACAGAGSRSRLGDGAHPRMVGWRGSW